MEAVHARPIWRWLWIATPSSQHCDVIGFCPSNRSQLRIEMAMREGALFQEKVSRLLGRQHGKPVLKSQRTLALGDPVAHRKLKKGGMLSKECSCSGGELISNSNWAWFSLCEITQTVQYSVSDDRYNERGNKLSWNSFSGWGPQVTVLDSNITLAGEACGSKNGTVAAYCASTLGFTARCSFGVVYSISPWTKLYMASDINKWWT